MEQDVLSKPIAGVDLYSPQTNIDDLPSRFGLPKKVVYCKKCVESNQRFMGSIPHADQKGDKKDTTTFDDEGICGACRYFEFKETIDWAERERQLMDLCDQYRSHDGSYDILIPGSGGKDSCYASHIMKTKYNMNPLTVTWAPHIYTDIGWKNFQSWIHSGFDNQLYTPNGQIHRKLTKLAFENLLHPFQPFVLGQYSYVHKVAIEKNIPFIMYGDYAPEKGVGTGIDFTTNILDPALFACKEDQPLYFGGVHIDDLPQYGITKKDLIPYMPADVEKVNQAKIQSHYLPFYLNYDPQKCYYYAAEHCGFEPNPDGRTDGTYTKYQSLDDKVDGFHYYTWYIKTGRARTTEDAALEIRNKHITRDEGLALVRKFDGELPKTYFKDFLQFIDINEERFWEIIDENRPPHLWKKEYGQWQLRQPIS